MGVYVPRLLGTPIVPFYPFYLGVSVLKLNTGKKGTLIIMGLLGSLDWYTPSTAYPTESLISLVTSMLVGDKNMQARNIPVHGETVNPVQSGFPSCEPVDGQNLACTYMSYSLNSLNGYPLDSVGDYSRGY